MAKKKKFAQKILRKLKFNFWKLQLYIQCKKMRYFQKKYCNKGYHHIRHCYAYLGTKINYFDFAYILPEWNQKEGKIVQYLKCKDCNLVLFPCKTEMEKYKILKDLPELPK